MNHDKTKCEYCGQVLPLGVDKRTRQIRSFHFEQHAAERNKEEAPQPRKRLDVHEILDLMPEGVPARYDGELIEFARAIEAAVWGEKT
jgi:hypothetical protein